MSVRKRIFFLLLISLIFLSSCGEEFAAQNVENLIELGVIAPIGERVGEEDAPITQFVEVRRGTIYRDVNLPIRAEFPVVHYLRFERQGGIYSGSFIGSEVGARVREGDLLAEQSFENIITEQTMISHYRLLMQIDQFEEQFIEERANRLSAIEDKRQSLYIASPAELEIMTLQLARMELQLEQFLLTSSQTRRNLNQQLEDFEETLQGERMYAPVNGVVTRILLNRPGALVESTNQMYFAVADERYIQFEMSAPISTIRYGNVFTIRGVDNSMDFEAQVISDPLAPGRRVSLSPLAPPPPLTISFTLVPVDKTNFNAQLEAADLTIADLPDMEFRLFINEPLVSNALILPIGAIRPEDRVEYVLIYENGSLSKRYITRGLTFQNEVQVLMGVEEGQRVALR